MWFVDRVDFRTGFLGKQLMCVSKQTNKQNLLFPSLSCARPRSQFDAYQTSAEIRSRDPKLVDPYALNLTRTLEAALQLTSLDGATTGRGGARPSPKNGAFVRLADATLPLPSPAAPPPFSLLPPALFLGAYCRSLGARHPPRPAPPRLGPDLAVPRAQLDACWHHAGAWPTLQIEGTTAWDAMATWYQGLGARAAKAADGYGGAAAGRRYWKESAPQGFPCTECCPATHPPACDHGCSSCCGPLWG